MMPGGALPLTPHVHARVGQRAVRRMGAAVLLALLAACATAPRPVGDERDDGPGRLPANLQAIPDAVPRIEPFAPANLRPYVIHGRRYTPMRDNRGFRQEGLASWYGKKFHGKRTANGEMYDMYAMTAAHPTLPIPSYARVTRKNTGQSVIVRINDRGPFHSSRIIDLSYVAAAKLGLIAAGTGTVIVEAIAPEQIRAGTFAATPPVASAPPAPGAQATAPVFLQFGAFSVADYARRLADRLQNLQQNASVRQGSDGLHRVLVGPYATRAAALTAAHAIAQRSGLPSAIALN